MSNLENFLFLNFFLSNIGEEIGEFSCGIIVLNWLRLTFNLLIILFINELQSFNKNIQIATSQTAVGTYHQQPHFLNQSELS